MAFTTSEDRQLKSIQGALLPADIGTTVQAFDADLTAIAALAGAGILSRTAANTYALRSLAAGSTKVSITDGDGVSGNPTIDVVPAQISINDLANTLDVGNGGTGSSTTFTAGSVVFAGGSGVYSQDNANFFWDDSNDRLGIGTATPGVSLDINATDAIQVPSGTTAQRAGTPAAGMMRWNSSLSCVEYYDGSNWKGLTSKLIADNTYSGGDVSLGTTTATVADVSNHSVTFTADYVGDYLVIFTFTHRLRGNSSGDADAFITFQLEDGTTTKGEFQSSFRVNTSTSTLPDATRTITVSENFNYTSTGSKTIDLQRINNFIGAITVNSIISDGTNGTSKFKVYYIG